MAIIKQTFKASDYTSREDLEKIIRAEVGDEISENRAIGHIITGTREELLKFGIDDTSSIFGVKVVVTDKPLSDILKEKKNENRKNN